MRSPSEGPSLSPIRSGVAGIAIVVILAVFATAALPTRADTSAVSSASSAVAPQDAPDGLPGFAGPDIPERFRLHLSGAANGETSDVRKIVATAAPRLGPRPTDFPFGANVPVWTDPRAQNRPSMAVDSTGRIYVAFDHATTATNRDIYVTWSDDGGSTWGTPVPIADTTYNEGNASIAITTGDRVNVFFDSDDTGTPSAFHADTEDRGATWTVRRVTFGTFMLQDLRLPSVASTGPGVYGMYEIRTIPAGASSIVILTTEDISTGTWRVWYYDAPLDVELFHPATGYAPAGTGVLLGAVAVEIVDNAKYDLTWFRFDPVTEDLVQDWFMCGYACPSNQIPYPAVATDGLRGVVGADYLNTTFLGPYWRFMVVHTDNVTRPWNWTKSFDASGRQFSIDNASADQRWLHFSLQGTQAVAGYWKENATWYVGSDDGGGFWGQPYRVSDNSPGSAIDGPRAVATASSAAGPVLAWQDGRAMNPDIYFATLDSPAVAVALDTVPANLLVRFDGGVWQTAPVTAYFTVGSQHTIETTSPQSGFTGIQYWFENWNDSTTDLVKTITVTANVTYTAFFSTQYYLIVTTYPGGLNITVDGVTQAAPVEFWCDLGSSFTVDAPSPQSVDPDTRYRFDRWSDGGLRSHMISCRRGPVGASFILQYRIVLATHPAGLNVTADGTSYPSGTVLWWDWNTTHRLFAPPEQTGAGAKYLFQNWEGGPSTENWTVASTGPATYTAVYGAQYLSTVDTSPTGLQVDVDGTTYAAPAQFWWDEGSSHLLHAPGVQMADSDTRYVFQYWEGGPSTENWTVVIGGAATYRAVYGTEYLISFDTNPTGLELDIDGTNGTAPMQFWWAEGTAHNVSAPSPQPGPGGGRYVFLNWSDGDPSASRTIVVDAPTSLTADYQLQYYIRMLTDVGTVTPGDGWYEAGRVIPIDAIPPSPGAMERFSFGNWSGDYTGDLPMGSIFVDGPKTVRANWIHEFRIDIESLVPGLTIDVDSMPRPTPATLWWAEGSYHTLTAPPMVSLGADARWDFSSWTGGTSRVLTVPNVAGPATYAAGYTKMLRVVVLTSPLERTVLLDGAPYTDPVWVPEGTEHTFDAGASPQPGGTGTRYVFRSWSPTPGTALERLTVTSPMTLTATYDTHYQLTIDSQYGDPACEGAADPDGCWYLAGTTAHITVSSPFNATNGTRYALAGWSGDASGSNATVSVTMDGPKAVTASWDVVSPGGGPAVPNDALPLLVGAAAAVIAIAALGAAYVLLRRRGKGPV